MIAMNKNLETRSTACAICGERVVIYALTRTISKKTPAMYPIHETRGLGRLRSTSVGTSRNGTSGCMSTCISMCGRILGFDGGIGRGCGFRSLRDRSRQQRLEVLLPVLLRRRRARVDEILVHVMRRDGRERAGVQLERDANHFPLPQDLQGDRFARRNLRDLTGEDVALLRRDE